MAHSNNFHEKRQIQHNTHNRRAGVAKFKRNLGHRKSRRWRNRISREWTEEREQLDKSRRAIRNNRNNIWERDESEMS